MVLSSKEILHRRILYGNMALACGYVGYMLRLEWLEEERKANIALEAGFKSTPQYPLPSRSPEFTNWLNGPEYLKWKQERENEREVAAVNGGDGGSADNL